MHSIFKAESGDFVRGLEVLKNRFGHQVGFEEFLVSLELDLGLLELGMRHALASDGGFVTGLGRVSARLIIVRFDLDQQIPFLDLLSLFDRQIDDLPGHFRTDDDLHHGLNFSIGDHQFGDVSAGDLFRLDSNGDLSLLKNCHQAQADQPDDDGGKNDYLSDFFTLIRVGHFVPSKTLLRRFCFKT
jgi:hypothetical protein